MFMADYTMTIVPTHNHNVDEIDNPVTPIYKNS
jgi:hypothetical protein